MMQTILPAISLFIGLLGIIIGSFLNVVILRLHTGRGNGGRSMCLSCAKQLAWFELIPIVSFFVLGRRCGGCKSSLSWQYPLVELSTGILFVLVFLKTIPLFIAGHTSIFFISLALLWAAWSLLVVIFVYDLYHKIIPNVLSYTLAAITFVYQLLHIVVQGEWSTTVLLNLLAGPLLFLPFWILWSVSKGRWIGLGDGKLALSIGWMFGLQVSITALVLSFWIGALVGVALLLISSLSVRRSGITMKSEIPFAPFLILGMLISFLVPIDFLHLSLLFAVM